MNCKFGVAFTVIFSFICFNNVRAMSKNDLHITNANQDSIYKIWKFKNAELVKDTSSVLKTVDIEKYDLWDLTKKGTLSYTVTDSPGVTHSQPYKLLKNAIVFQFPNSENKFVVKFKITKLTSEELILILHVTYTIVDKTYAGKEKNRDEDLLELSFEAVDQ